MHNAQARDTGRRGVNGLQTSRRAMATEQLSSQRRLTLSLSRKQLCLADKGPEAD